MPVETHLDTERATELEKAFLEHHEMVYRAAFRITGNASDAEDVLQTLFLRLLRREWAPDYQQGWPAYLHRAAVNVALDIVRTRTRQAPLGETEFELQENRPDAHREHSANELREWVTKELAQMKPAWAEMFVLRYVEGCDVHDVARMLGTSKGTVTVTLFRVRRRLQKSIRQFLGGR